MSNGTRPAVVFDDLMSGDGPHGDAADRFVAGQCIKCGDWTAEVVRDRSDGWCERCRVGTASR